MSRLALTLIAFMLLAVAPAHANEPAPEETIILQSTTSTQNSGLYEYLLPIFTEKTGVEVRVVAVGTGQALKNAMNCDGDVVLVHARQAEEDFVASGHGVARSDLMYNDFVIVGPDSDPAGIAGMADPNEALAAIAEKEAVFVSRGDDSGTHQKEMTLWQAAGVDPTAHSGEWYRETGAGMGAALNIAVGMDGYILTDRATWISFNNKGDFRIMVEGAESLFNQYGVILVSTSKCEKTRAEAGQKFIDWLLSEEGQAAIAAYRMADQQLFFPNAED